MGALSRVKEYNFEIYAVYIDKKCFQQFSLKIGAVGLHNWMTKTLLEGMPISEAKITIDGRSGRDNMRRTVTYLRRGLNDAGRGINIKFEESHRATMVQLADLVAGSINRSFQSQKTDCRRYLRVIKHKIVKIEQVKTQ